MTANDDFEQATAANGRERRPVLGLGWHGLLLNFVFWTGLATLLAVTVVFFPLEKEGHEIPVGPRHELEYSLRLAVAFFPVAYAWALATPPIFWLATRFSLEYGRRPAHAALFAGLAILILPAVVLVASLMIAWIVQPLPED
jgi:MFS family permease